MDEPPKLLFISTSSRRQWRYRGIRRRHQILAAMLGPTATTLGLVAVGAAAFLVGRFGI